MSDSDKFKHKGRGLVLAQMKGDGVLDPDELSLFEWYADEHSKLIDKIESEEKKFIQDQMESGADLGDVNDSGMLAAEYYVKRMRYADIIYMASLLESYLARACKWLIAILGDHNVIFRPDELAGDKWTKRKMFLEGYGRFKFPKGAWSDLQTLIRVRNILIHENGSSDTISQSDRSRIEKCPGISINQYELEIDKEYVDHCISAFRSLVKFLDEKLDQGIDRSLQPQAVKRE